MSLIPMHAALGITEFYVFVSELEIHTKGLSSYPKTCYMGTTVNAMEWDDPRGILAFV